MNKDPYDKLGSRFTHYIGQQFVIFLVAHQLMACLNEPKSINVD